LPHFWKEPIVVQYFFAVLETLKAREDEGQGLVEYALIIALIAIVCIVALTALGVGIGGALDAITAEL